MAATAKAEVFGEDDDSPDLPPAAKKPGRRRGGEAAALSQEDVSKPYFAPPKGPRRASMPRAASAKVPTVDPPAEDKKRRWGEVSLEIKRRHLLLAHVIYSLCVDSLQVDEDRHGDDEDEDGDDSGSAAKVGTLPAPRQGRLVLPLI